MNSTINERAEILETPDADNKPAAISPKTKVRVNPDEETATPFPIDALPKVVADMAQAIAITERTPEILSGCCVLGILSACIGAGLQVKSGPNRTTRGNLYLVPSAESGSGKSESYRHAAKPFFSFQSTMCEAWKTNEGPKLKSQKMMLEIEISQIKKNAVKLDNLADREAARAELQKKMGELETLSDKEPLLYVEDVTTEKLAVSLAESREQLASMSPDAGSIVNNLLGRYSKLERTDESIYLKAFSGDNCRVDRQGRASVSLQSPCLSALWLVQPDKIETLLGERSLTDGGLIPRLLICHTHATPQKIKSNNQGEITGISPIISDAWAKLVQEILQKFRLAAAPVTIEPTPEAREAMNLHFNAIVDRRCSDLRDVSTYAARWNEQAWRIAVCLHAGTHGQQAGDGRKLDLSTAQKAIRLADWFGQQQLQILAAGRHEAKRGKLQKILELVTPDGITGRDVQRALRLPTADEAHELLAELEVEGAVIGRDSQPANGGHVMRIFTPAMHQ